MAIPPLGFSEPTTFFPFHTQPPYGLPSPHFYKKTLSPPTTMIFQKSHPHP